MDKIRLATPEEIEHIQSGMDITPASTVVTFGGKDFAVVRIVQELDPVIFAEDTSDKRKLLFLMNLETALRLQGSTEIYFNLPADDKAYLAVMEHWGAEEKSKTPVVRYKKVL